MIDGHRVPDTQALESLTIRELVLELSRIEDVTADVTTSAEDAHATHVTSEREPLIIGELRKRAAGMGSLRHEDSTDQKAAAWES